MTRSTTAVVVCAYTLERWDDLADSVASAASQNPPPDELLLVVDHNHGLLHKAVQELVPRYPSLRVVPSHRKKGLSGARNSGLEVVSADVVVFLDDDATAEAGWLERLVAPYADPTVLAVGGAAEPTWPAGAGRPATLPAPPGEPRGELDWVVGCTYRGQPTSRRPVRNLMGCNMSFRSEVFAAVGGFNEDLGRVGRTPLGCEETELCIRAARWFPGTRILFEPAAVVHHRVSRDRLTWGYLRRRSSAEGLSKAAVAAMVGPGEALATERGYVASVLPTGVRRQVTAALRTADRMTALAGAAAILVALASTAAGYARGRVLGRRVFRSASAAPGPPLEVARDVVSAPGAWGAIAGAAPTDEVLGG